MTNRMAWQNPHRGVVAGFQVGAVQDAMIGQYSQDAPYSPAQRFPEYPFPTRTIRQTRGRHPGNVYELLRTLLAELGLDAANFGTAAWNPLGEFVHPGDVVLVKPNLVRHSHGRSSGIDCLTTHGSVVRAVVDYVCVALCGVGKIIVADSPIQGADFDAVVQETGLQDVVEFYRSQDVDIELLDFRTSRAIVGSGGRMRGRVPLRGDPRGSKVVDLGTASWFCAGGPGGDRYRVTCYDPNVVGRHHTKARNEYTVGASALFADAVINMPKMKTHRKVGVTAALKNAVGVSVDKDWLPHHRMGSPAQGGDEYPSTDFVKAAESFLLDRENSAECDLPAHAWRQVRRALRAVMLRPGHNSVREGDWYGNDTAWRMALDLNRILLYASKGGDMLATPQRRMFNVVDGIVAGDGEGPLEARARPVGVLLAGDSSAAVDAVVARLMGFDYRRIPIISNAFSDVAFPLIFGTPGAVKVHSNVEDWSRMLITEGTWSLQFDPPDGWKGHIEIPAAAEHAERHLP